LACIVANKAKSETQNYLKLKYFGKYLTLLIVGIIPASLVAAGTLTMLLPIMQFQILKIVSQDLFNLRLLSMYSTWASSIKIIKNQILIKQFFLNDKTETSYTLSKIKI